MSCLPNTPIAANILSDPAALGWSDVGSSLLTTSLTRYYPIVGAFVTVRAMTTTNQHAIIRQVDFEETAATSGDIKKHPLLVYVLGAGGHFAGRWCCLRTRHDILARAVRYHRI